MGWLGGWLYRKEITLSRASGAVTNYQMKLLVGESSGATGEDVDCAAHCLSSFNDLRFTAADGTTLFDYWIESITGATPNQLATIWIKFDSIGTSATTFYMYYGKADAAAYSNGANTFILFDDFEWGNDEDDLTTSGGSLTWSSFAGIAKIDTAEHYGGSRAARVTGAAAQPRYSTPLAASSEISIMMRFKKETAVTYGPLLSQGNGTRRFEVYFDASENLKYYGSTAIDSGVDCVADSWQQLEVNNINHTAGTFSIYLNGNLSANATSMYTSSA
jgi:hypothetical protein